MSHLITASTMGTVDTLTNTAVSLARRAIEPLSAIIAPPYDLTLPLPLQLLGREDSVQDVVQRIISGKQQLIALAGPPGGGKSSIARGVIHHKEIATAFGEFRKWLTCDTRTSLHRFRTTIAAILQMASQSAKGLLTDAQTLDITNSQVSRLLIVLDGFEYLWDRVDSQPQVQDLIRRLCSTPTITVVVTVRGSEMTSFINHTVAIPRLDNDSAEEMFLAIHTYPDDHLSGLLLAVDHNPLFVTLLAQLGVRTGASPKELLELWKDQGSNLFEGRGGIGSRVANSIDSAIDGAISVSHNAHNLFGMLAMLPSGVDPTCLPWFPGFQDALQTLRSQSLIIPESSGRLRLLSPIRSYAIQHHILSSSERGQIYFTYFKHLRLTAARSRRSFREAIKFYATEQSNFYALLEDALGHGYVEVLKPILDNPDLMVCTTANIPLTEKAVEVVRKHRRHDLIAPCLRWMGYTLCSVGYLRRGIDTLEEAASAFKKQNNLAAAARCKHICGSMLIRRGKESEGKAELDEACNEYKRANDFPGQAGCLMEINWDDNRNEARQLLDSPHGDEGWKQAWSSYHQASIHMMLDEIEDGFAVWMRTLERFRSVGDLIGVTNCLTEIDISLEDRLDINTRLGRRLDAALDMTTLSKSHLRAGRFKDALTLQHKAIDEFNHFEFIYNRAAAWTTVGDIYMEWQRVSDAHDAFEIAAGEHRRCGEYEEAEDAHRKMQLCLALQRLSEIPEDMLDAKAQAQADVQNALDAVNGFTDFDDFDEDDATSGVSEGNDGEEVKESEEGTISDDILDQRIE